MTASYPYRQIVFFGDSLFEGSDEVKDGFSFQAKMSCKCTRYFDVLNRGFGGWNTANAIQYIAEIFPAPTKSGPKIEYFFVLLGANDAVIPLPTTSQHVPIDEYKANLVKIVNHPHIQAHKPTICIVTPPPLDEIKVTREDKKNGHSEAIRRAAVSAAYSEKAREVARENDLILIDLWKAIMDAGIAKAPGDYTPGGPWLGTPENGKQGGLDELLPDGLHMNGEAYQILYNAIAPHIKMPAKKVFPEWSELNPIKPQ